MTRVGNDDKGRALELTGKAAARAEGNPAVRGTPDEERRRVDSLELAVEGVEVELAQHRSERGAVGRVRDRSVILIDVPRGDLPWIGVRGPEEPLEDTAPGVDRCPEAVQEHDGRARSGVDVADPGPSDREETRAERRAGRVASALGKGRGPTRQGKGQKGQGRAPHGAPLRAP